MYIRTQRALAVGVSVRAQLKKIGLTEEDIPGEIYNDWNKIDDWIKDKANGKEYELTEEEYMLLIKGENGNAFYQTFEKKLNNI